MMVYGTFQTPILLLIFNRPDLTKLVFERIKQMRPRSLYIAADGPRNAYPEDIMLCDQARAIVHEIDWDCQVTTRFLSHNLGCGRAVSSAITWFFDHVEAGIILEDDCIPHHSFFSFTQEMLLRYADDERIAMISGTNLMPDVTMQQPYFFARYYDIWGWATWRRSWQLYDYAMCDWPNNNLEQRLIQSGISNPIRRFWMQHFNKIVYDKLDTWDYQWSFCCLFNNRLSVIPRVNLVANHGLWGAHANGTKSIFHELPTHDMTETFLSCIPTVTPHHAQEYAIYKAIGAYHKKSLRTVVKEWIGL